MKLLEIPRWPHILLLAGTVLTVVTSLGLRLKGHSLPQSFLPLKRLYGWLVVLLLIGLGAVMRAIALQEGAHLNP
jgi:hypothetical protein